MNQRKVGSEIAARMWKKDLVFYVQSVPGDGGSDWGYTTDRAKALPLNKHFMRRFVADCKRVGAVALRSYA